MPLDKTGKYRMNPEQSRAADSMPKPAPIAAPGAGDGAGDQTITLTIKPDGTATCDSGDGKPMPYSSVDEALDAVKAQYGSRDESADQGSDMSAGDGAGSDSDFA